jgi:succinate dehydrogenase / fumarate reductase flavoprotein subunit
VVFGRRAGEAAAAYARGLTGGRPRVAESEIEAETKDLVAPFERTSGESPFDVHAALQQTMNDLVGIYRNEKDMQKALEELAKLRARARDVRIEGSRLYNPGWHLCRDLRNMLLVSEAVTKSAIVRKESRGAHSRLDYPNLDPALGKVNTSCVRSGETMNVHTTPLPEIPAELKRLFEAAQQPAGAKA